MLNNSYENFFINFSNKTKLKIILCLKEKDSSVKEISEKINEEQSTVSHNLKKLYECNILIFRKKGKERIYSLNKDTVLPMLKIVERHACKYCKNKCNKKCVDEKNNILG